MVKITVLYGHPEDPEAFEQYYTNEHMPLVGELPHLQQAEVARVVATPDGGEPPYYRITELWFSDMDQMQQSLSSEEGQAVTGDLPTSPPAEPRSLSPR